MGSTQESVGLCGSNDCCLCRGGLSAVGGDGIDSVPETSSSVMSSSTRHRVWFTHPDDVCIRATFLVLCRRNIQAVVCC